MPGPILYFAYGSNLNDAQMRERCPDSSPYLSGLLPGYRLAFSGSGSHWGRGGTATILADGKSEVPGLLYHMTLADVDALNRWEGFPRAYGQLDVTVRGVDGATHKAITYQKNGNGTNPPHIKYLHQIWAAYRKLGLDETALLAAVEEGLNGQE